MKKKLEEHDENNLLTVNQQNPLLGFAECWQSSALFFFIKIRYNEYASNHILDKCVSYTRFYYGKIV